MLDLDALGKAEGESWVYKGHSVLEEFDEVEQWNGMEWNGMEWNRMEWNGMEWNRME